MEQKNYARKKYKRLVLKLSGEVLAGSQNLGIDVATIQNLSQQILEIHNIGVEIAIVIGGGNFFRGMKAAGDGMDRVTADYAGMMATVMNGLTLQNFLEQNGMFTRLQTAVEIKSVAESFIRRKAIRHLEKKRIVILSGGTGNPYFTTDTTAALRAVELGADVILKATKVNGVYDDDPEKNLNARRFKKLSFMDALQKQLKVMDATAFSLCMENNMPIQVFSVENQGNLKRVVEGEPVGTIIMNDRSEFYE